MVALSGDSAADACLLNAPFSGTVILDNFFEKFLDDRLPKLVPIPPSGNCSGREVLLRIPGFVAKGFVDVKKGFSLSTAPPAALLYANGCVSSSFVVVLAAPGLILDESQSPGPNDLWIGTDS